MYGSGGLPGGGKTRALRQGGVVHEGETGRNSDTPSLYYFLWMRISTSVTPVRSKLRDVSAAENSRQTLPPCRSLSG